MFKTPLSIDILSSSGIGVGEGIVKMVDGGVEANWVGVSEVEEADVGGINCGVEVRFGVVGETDDLLMDLFIFVGLGLELEGTNAELTYPDDILQSRR